MDTARTIPLNPTLDEAEHGSCRVGDLGHILVTVDDDVDVHPTAQIGNTAEWIGHPTSYGVELRARVIVRAFVTVDAGVERETRIGADTLLMAHVHVGHDVRIGERCQLAPGTVVGGMAELGDDVKVGINATILPWRKIGDGARVGAGAVVTHDIPAGEVWAGNPARRLR